jgi:putative ABC transport system permease protein
MGGLWQDVKYGVRTLGKNPGFTATAVITLALAIGANTAVFSVVDPLLLRKLPVERPDELVLVGSAGTLHEETISEYSTYEIYREKADVLSGVFGCNPLGDFHTVNDTSFDTDGEFVTGSYFAVLGVRPFRGRMIAPDDDLGSNGIRVAVLSYDFWRKAYGGNDDVIGRTIPIRNLSYTVIGVTPPEFFGIEVGRSPDFYIPLATSTSLTGRPPDEKWLKVIGRMKRGVSIERASAGLEPFFAEAKRLSKLPKIEIQQDFLRVVLTPMGHGLGEARQRYSTPGKILITVVVFLLLIGCANVANLMLARAATRTKEFTVRLALGSGRARLIRQLLVESTLVTVAGTIVATVAAIWVSRILYSSLSTTHYPLELKTGLDGRVFGFTAGIAVLATILSGLAPAFFSTRQDLAHDLRVQSSSSGQSLSKSRLSRALVITQVAICISVLTAAGLLAHSLANLETMNVGFDRDRVLGVTFTSGAKQLSGEQLRTFNSELLTRTNSLPGVRSVAVASFSPVSGALFGVNVQVEGRVAESSGRSHIFFSSVSPGYFTTMGIPMLAGRDFTERDTPGVGSVAIINETMARHYFGSANPLGERLKFVEGSHQPMEIVGVAADSKYNDLRESTPDFLYVPATINRYLRTLVIRTNQNAKSIEAPMRDVVRSLNSTVEIESIATMREQIDESLHQDRLVAALSGGFSLLALALTAVGLFGVLQFSVARRTSEIGVRMALGARPADIFRLIVGNGMALVVIGLTIGAGGAVAAGRLLRGMLFGVKGFDPLAMGSVVVVLGVAAFLACYLPARRASRVDPMRALRSE